VPSLRSTSEGKRDVNQGGVSNGARIVGLLIWAGVKWNAYTQSPEYRADVAKKEAQAETDRKANAAKEEADRRAAEEQVKASLEEAKKLKERAKTFSADQVVSYYSANEVAGDEAMKGRVYLFSVFPAGA
jgi:hypothetical protein